MGTKIKHITHAEWESTVLDAPGAVVDFYSTECPPCEAFAAKFEPVSEIYGNDIVFVKIFRQENRDLAESLGVSGSPTVLFYKDGKETGTRLTGGIKRADLIRNLDALLTPERAAELAAEFVPQRTDVQLAILGGGPAGLTAAIYAAQAKIDTLVIDTALPGGQVGTTHLVSNYPGFPEPVQGFMLAHYMSEQAKAAGAQFLSAVDVTSVDLEKKEIVVDGLHTVAAQRIIVATGSSPRPLGVPGEKEYKGNGISYCATCDAKYFEGKHAIVVGGGNSAIEEALFISRFAGKITIIHQFDELQANKTAQEKAFADPKIEFVLSHEPREFIKNPDGTMTVKAENLKTKENVEINADGVFVFVGMRPNLTGIDGLKRDEWGYLTVDADMRTSIPGVFAAGDVAAKKYRQITVGTAEGTIAAIEATKDLES